MAECLNKFLKQWKEEISSTGSQNLVGDSKECKGPASSSNSSLRLDSKKRTYSELNSLESKKQVKDKDHSSDSLNNDEDNRNYSKNNTDDLLHAPINKNKKSGCDASAFNYVNSLLIDSSDLSLTRTSKHIGKFEEQNKNSAVHVSQRNKLYEKNSGDVDKEKYLETFLADLEEINEIPFFELTVPREVAMNIFRHFDIVDLCRCAQVSKSWKSLAEDDLLWCVLCHKLGYELESVTVDRNLWKSRARELYIKDRTLIHNWKNRIGRYKELSYVQGGILCAADSRDALVAGGYTNGQICVCNLETGLEQVYRPSSISLMIDENTAAGTLNNVVTSVKLGSKIVAALYSQGIVDVWSIDGDVNPLHTGRTNCTASFLTCSRERAVVAYSFDRQVKMIAINDRFRTDVADFGKNIQWMKFVPGWNEDALCIQTGSIIRLLTPGAARETLPILHEMADSFVSCVDVNQEFLTVAVTSYGLLDGCKVQVYNIRTGVLMTSLGGFYGMDVKCMNSSDSPHNFIITGGADRKVYIHDIRQPRPFLTLSPNLSLSQVQMDDLKAVVSAHDGQTCVYDLRTKNKLWEFHNRHPVLYSRFSKHHLVTANVPVCKYPDDGEHGLSSDHMTHKRFRGGIHVYDFSVTNETEGIPSICKSNYDTRMGYSYNINLTMPYDAL